MNLKDVDGMKNGVDPAQTAPRGLSDLFLPNV